KRIELFGTTEHRDAIFAGQRQQHAQRHLDRRCVRDAQRTTYEVEQRALALVAHGMRQLRPTRCRNETAKMLTGIHASHPSGNPMPSRQDMLYVASALRCTNIRVPPRAGYYGSSVCPL